MKSMRITDVLLPQSFELGVSAADCTMAPGGGQLAGATLRVRDETRTTARAVMIP